MKNVAFDARMVSHPGIGRYMRSLLESMMDTAPDLQFDLIGEPGELQALKRNANVTIKPCRIPIYSLAEQFGMRKYFEKTDLVHVPHFSTPWRLPARTVVTIHDLIHFHVPAYRPFPGALYLLRNKLSSIGEHAAKIILVSEATRRDFLKMFPEAADKTRVIHEAAHEIFSGGDNVTGEVTAKSGKPYLLYVGSIREHKNVQYLLEAYERFVRKRGSLAELVLVGRLDKRFEKKYRFRECLRRLKFVRHEDDCDDVRLRQLYRRAACLIMPSGYEGFGLPVLEAMAAGTPVIANAIPSVKEVAGDAALFYAPGQIDALCELIYDVLSDGALRQSLSAKGIQRAREFSWKKAARETLSVYEEVWRDFVCTGGDA